MALSHVFRSEKVKKVALVITTCLFFCRWLSSMEDSWFGYLQKKWIGLRGYESNLTATKEEVSCRFEALAEHSDITGQLFSYKFSPCEVLPLGAMSPWSPWSPLGAMRCSEEPESLGALLGAPGAPRSPSGTRRSLALSWSPYEPLGNPRGS